MSLLCFQGATGAEGVYRLAPVWAADPPTSYQLSLDSFDEIKNDKTGVPEIGWSSHYENKNAGEIPVERTVTWSFRQPNQQPSLFLRQANGKSVAKRLLNGVQRPRPKFRFLEKRKPQQQSNSRSVVTMNGALRRPTELLSHAPRRRLLAKR